VDPPVIISISPAAGPSTGGVIVVISGSGLDTVTSVSFGDVPAASISIGSESQISVETPAISLNGTVNVVVANEAGFSEINAAATFTFDDSAVASSDTTSVDPVTDATAVGDTTVGDTASRAAAVCCTTAFNVPTGRSGCTQVGNKVGEQFRMEADFGSTGPGCTCSCGEYRQYIRGAFSVNGRNVQHLVPNPGGGAPLPMRARPAAGAADGFLEDGIPTPPAGINVYYGHRGEGSTDPSDTYATTRATGCQYRGSDFPGITAPTGTTYVIDLDFRGQIVDVCNAGQVKNTADWLVNCTGTI
jgi:hypothetical protein